MEESDLSESEIELMSEGSESEIELMSEGESSSSDDHSVLDRKKTIKKKQKEIVLDPVAVTAVATKIARTTSVHW